MSSDQQWRILSEEITSSLEIRWNNVFGHYHVASHNIISNECPVTR